MARKKKPPLDPGLIQHIKSLGLPNPLNPGPGLAYAPILDEPYYPTDKHAPGPWVPRADYIASNATGLKGNLVCRQPGMAMSRKYWAANRNRILACVNALEGVHNPKVLHHQVLKTLRYINGKCFTAFSDDGVLSIELGSQANVDKFVIGLAQLVRELDGQETGGGDE